MSKNSERARHVATARHELHKDQKSHRQLSDDYEYVGILGEMDFADEYGFTFNDELYIAGDGGVDFSFHTKDTRKYTIDVKTAQRPKNLIVEVGKITSDIYILRGFKDDSTYAIGWETKTNIAKAQTGTMLGHNVVNHIISAKDLLPMELFVKFLQA
jgi:hypothetical protein